MPSIDDKINKMKDKCESSFNHYANPLHIYCRLRDVGIKESYAKRLAKLYENKVYNIYRKIRDNYQECQSYQQK